MRTVVAASALLLFAFASIMGVTAAPTRPTLPDQFIVSTGTTLPIPDLEPVAQSGTIYFDRPNGRMRVDAFWMGTTRTLLVDIARQRAHIINGASCTTSAVTGALLPVSVPEAATRDHDKHAVRGVEVDRFHHIVREERDLVHIEYLLRRSNVTVTAVSPELAESMPHYWTPWRITSRRAERREMIPAPDSPNPNWRFFGEDVSDAIVRYGGDGRAIARLVRDVTATVDFYNFVPMTPDPSVFEAPDALCSGAPTAEHGEDFDLFTAQRHMMELSFNSEEGRRLMTQLWADLDHSRELPAETKAEAAGDL
jgi:hypothetical protein